jgi:lysophospholipase L1-like esterase
MRTILTPLSTDLGALDMEAYIRSRVIGSPSTPGHVWYGYEMAARWKAAVARVLAGTGPAKVLCIGDSTTAGIGSSGGYANQNSWPSVMARMLFRNVAQTTYGLTIPPSDDRPTSDPRWVLGAGWAQATETGVGLGNRHTAYKSGPGGGALTFLDTRLSADRYDIYYVTNNSSAAGTFTAQVGGGTPVVINCNTGAKSLQKVTVNGTAPSSSTPVSITNTGGTGNVWIVGIEPWQSTANARIRVGNAGVSASSAAGWLAKESGGTDSWNVLAFLPLYAPDLTIIDLGINDSGTPVLDTDFLARMQTLGNAAYAAGSAVLYKTMIPSSGSRFAVQQTYVTALQGSLSPRYALLDLFSHYGSHARNDARGWMYDWGHGTDPMYEDVGELVAEMLYRYAGL